MSRSIWNQWTPENLDDCTSNTRERVHQISGEFHSKTDALQAVYLIFASGYSHVFKLFGSDWNRFSTSSIPVTAFKNICHQPPKVKVICFHFGAWIPETWCVCFQTLCPFYSCWMIFFEILDLHGTDWSASVCVQQNGKTFGSFTKKTSFSKWVGTQVVKFKSKNWQPEPSGSNVWNHDNFPYCHRFLFVRCFAFVYQGQLLCLTSRRRPPFFLGGGTRLPRW